MADSGNTSFEIDKNEEESKSSELIPGFKDVTSFSQAMLTSVMGAIKSSNELPAEGDDFDYYSSFETFRSLMNIEGQRILQLMQTLMKHEGVKGNLHADSHHMDVEDRFDVLVDANDQLLERVGNLLDEAAGIKKAETSLVVASTAPKSTATNASWNKKPTTPSTAKKSSYRLLAARFVQRPQLKFKEKVDNTSRPFYPKLTVKPHALKSLNESIRLNLPDDDEEDEKIVSNDYPHPYEYEINQLEYDPSKLEKQVPKEPLPIEETPLTFVDKLPDLEKMISVLRKEQEIAVDLEHHSYRSYLGITCLIQISSRSQDWIVDALALRSDIHLLNDVMTDPNIIKALHGSDSDVDWLQRDFGVYIVNMFDTGQASRVLNMSRFSLAHLMSHYCQVTADKQYQLADWRIRPLPDELIKYAREDTHYLLYIYDKMKIELIEKGNAQKNLLISVFDRSKQLCLKKYKKPVCDEESHLGLYYKSRKVFNSQQMFALKQLFAWRDKVARDEDESLGYVMPNHMLLHISELLPRESQGVLACCNPIPPFVRQYLSEIHNIILEARDKQLIKLLADNKHMRPSVLEHPKYNASSLLNCPHDLSHATPEVGEDQKNQVNLDTSMIATSSLLFSSKMAIQPESAPPALTSDATFSGQITSKLKKVESILATLVSPFNRVSSPQPKVTWLKKPKLLGKRVSEPQNTWAKRVEEIKNKWGAFLTMAADKSDQEKQPTDPSDVKMEEGESVAEKFFKTKSGTNGKVGQKRKHEESEEDGRDVGRKKVIQEEVGERLKEFKAFNYSQSDFRVFEDSGKGRGKGEGKGKGKNKDFNPSGAVHFRAPAKSKSGKNLSSGKKSLQFSSKPSSSKQNWPKR
ncbi:exosome complex component 10-like [Lineus longissimus]|uniref:exosome complex component 10-like n=1 Tax=Lineus longissimus TaxID=88925 RepID=UPI00315CA5C1